MKPLLTILTGENSGTRFALEEGKKQIIGRDKTADICLPEKKISRRHASIVWDPEGQRILLEDLNSLNGTFLNGEPVSGQVRLRDQDRVQIGSFLLLFSYPEGEVAKPSTTSSTLKPRKVTSGPERWTDPLMDDPNQASKNRSSDLNSQTGGRMISGKLEELALADLLQLLATTKKTGRLILSQNRILSSSKPAEKGETLASLYFQNGELLHADYQGLVNEEAFFSLLRWTQGYFALFPHSDFDFPEPMTMPLEALLLDGFRRLDEEKANTVKFKATDSFDVNLDEPLTSLEPNELKIFQITWKQKSLEKIIKTSPFEKTATLDLIRELIKKGFVKKD